MSGKSVWLVILLLLVLVGASQAVRPTPSNPPYRPLLQGATLTPDVERIFIRACQDCHSNNTEWPWYSHVLPVSEIIASDVERGRAFLNLSDWQNYSRGRKLGYLGAMSSAAIGKEMPPGPYSLLHSDSRLSDAERQAIAAWARQEAARLRKQ